MRTTVILDDAFLARAAELTGTKEKPALLREALTALVQRGGGETPGQAWWHHARL